MPLQSPSLWSKSANADSKKKAFIAAPLIGTIIFLSAVLFTVNLNKIEAAQSARVVNDAYHNRIVSLIEIYRTDLAAVFRESVRRNIEEFILEPDWSSLELKNTDESNHYLTYAEIRKNRCQYIQQLSLEVVCTLGKKSVDASFGYGIPAWIEVANQKFSFEGIRFRPANPTQMSLLNPDRTDQVAIDKYETSCKNLIQQNMFDCNDFAQNPGHFQCKDDAGNIISGCVEGTFAMKINPLGTSPTNPQGDALLYAAMPRIEGDDGFGNQVRSGAISQQPFYLPINLRLFYYDDFALEFYDKLAFNSDSGRHPQTLGFVQGICAGSNVACENKAHIRNPVPGSPIPLSGGSQDAANSRAMKHVMRVLFRNGINTLKAKLSTLPSAERDPANGQYYTQFYLAYGDLPTGACLDDTKHKHVSQCQDILAKGTALSPADIAAIPGLAPQTDTDETGAGSYVAFYTDTLLYFFVLDDRPEFKIIGTEPNHPAYRMRFTVKPS